MQSHDRDVYSNIKVGDFFNDKFISIKLQMNKTDKDSKYVINRYIKDVDQIEKNLE